MKKIINLEKFIPNKTIREWVEAILFALIVAGVFRTWILAPYNVPTGSMTHTIKVGDHIFVNMNAYGFSVPMTDMKLFRTPVKRGEIIVFPYPEDPTIDFVKRVVAISGDKVRLKGEEVYVNGVKDESPYLFFDPNQIDIPNSTEFVVPEGKIWVMGDNRRNSKDSRYWGYLEESSVEGRASFIYWSHDSTKSLFEGYRFSRIGTLLK